MNVDITWTTEDYYKKHFTHDCDSCIFLKACVVDDKVYDLYLCQGSRGPTSGDIIARYGCSCNEYMSFDLTTGIISAVKGRLRSPLRQALEYVLVNEMVLLRFEHTTKDATASC